MKFNKSILFISLGAGFEYYDFIIYGLMIPYIIQVFFPYTNESSAIIQTFGIFAIGYIARPIGGFMLSMMADKIGRKPVLIFTMLLMSLSTISIGLLPSYHSVGWLATYLLLLLRIMQGIAFGAELPSAVTFIGEDQNLKKHSGFSNGVLMFIISIGASLAVLVQYLLSIYFDRAEMLLYGWRIPFIVGGLLGIINYTIRRNIEETEDFNLALQYKSIKFIIKNIWSYRTTILFAIIINLVAASLNSFNLYLPVYLSYYFGYNATEVSIASTIGIMWSAFWSFIFGIINDRMDSVKVIITSTIVFILGIFLFPSPTTGGSFSYTLLLVLSFQTIIAANIVSYLVLVRRLFPVEIRCSAVSICYNTSIVISSFTPVILTSLIEGNTSVWQITNIYFLVLSILTLIATLRFRNMKRY